MTDANATRASDFIASIGVNAHLQDATSSYGTSDVAAQIAYLGITNVRVSDFVGTQMAEYQALGAAGIKFDLVTVIAPQNPISLMAEMADIDSLAAYTISVEGPNEVNTDPVTYDGLTGADAAIAFQKDLYAAVHADPLLQGVKVLPFSLSVGGSLKGYGDVSAYADEANVHGYASDGVPPYYYLNYAVSSVTTVTGEPVVMTETGYYTLSDGNSGVNQDVQAKWLMDALLQNYADGLTKTYIYQLEDGGTSTTDPESNYGLFTAAGVAKQSAVDIHNLTTILADPGPAASTFTPDTLDYTVSGLADYGFQELFAKSDGRFDIALWSEPDFFNAKTDVEETVTASTVTVTLGGAYDIAVYDPVAGTGPIATYKDVSSVTLALGTDPLLVEVIPDTQTLTRSESLACYCPGTLILTDRGEAVVEMLMIGDTVVTAAGQHRPIRWIGRRSYAGRFLTANPNVQPVRFLAGSLGDGLPRRDLRVSLEHAMFIDGALIPARHLLNGSTITQERGLRRVDYFHIELDTHDVLLAEGAPSESFMDDQSRGIFHNASEFAVLYPDAPAPAGFYAPRIESGFQLEATRARLSVVAGELTVAA